MSVEVDLTGRRFGKLVVIERDLISPSKDFHKRWWCSCDCGNRKSVVASYLRDGRVVTCGCGRKTRLGDFTRSHGKSDTGAYNSWVGARSRCHNPSNPNFQWYGGRGITMCQRWRDSFSAFLEDMGDRPPGTTIDRINNDGDYTPGNCRWVTQEANCGNTRIAKSVLWRGQMRSRNAIARFESIPGPSLKEAARRFATMDEAVAHVKAHRRT